MDQEPGTGGGSPLDPPKGSAEEKSTELVAIERRIRVTPASSTGLPSPASEIPVPAIIARAGERVAFRYVEFFVAAIRNPNTRRAYGRAVERFLQGCEELGVELEEIHPLLVAAEYVLDRELHNTLQMENLDVDRLEKIVGDIGHWSLKVDTAMAGYHATQRLNRIIEEFRLQINDSTKVEQARALIVLLREIDVHPELWKVQNVYFSISRKILPKMQSRAAHGDSGARRWVELFLDLGSYLRVRID